MRQKLVVIFGAFFLAALLFTGPGLGPAAAGPIKLSYANFPPAPTFPCIQMERWKREVERRTGGKVVVDTYPGGTLLGAKNMMDGVIAGQADIGCLCMAYQPGRFVITNATSLPLGIPNSRVGSLMLWDLYKKYRPKAFSKVKVLTMFTTAPSNIMSRIPIRSLGDIRGVDLRASGGAAQILKFWGANPVGMPMPATPEALQKGVVKGLFSSLEVMKDFKFAELCKYATLTNTAVYPFAVVMNMEKWNSLPPDVQKVLEMLGTQQSAWTGTYMDNHAAESVAWSKKVQGVEFIELSAAQKAEWDARLKPITEKWVKETGAKGYPSKAIVEDILAFGKMYSGL
ncbi:MAG: TRAP transporter substrate-binding protein [Deltaproteobacteria bacterium]|nr:TRAP transporter substrate-binding protein [Deltaproteobacteria bacterium]MBW1922494.1 TRAP transporter substrate-binding protein [Deltaproteobacteria bacterium]MBW1948321.1 TRAP transporter substrate-binding protein [Deltaproteobacteria bacterium]MBW2006605.1 TRAP transporter substrate-binding protein [Deltaproteobacteria bacterium]MBW2103021.1 TRAP transporter substrate-binding protein [Deltaproteobacteria bacterium]